MEINKNGNSIVFERNGVNYVFPLNAIILISNDNSESVTLRLNASRKNIFTFSYKDVTNLSASSANELIELIGSLSNN